MTRLSHSYGLINKINNRKTFKAERWQEKTINFVQPLPSCDYDLKGKLSSNKPPQSPQIFSLLTATVFLALPILCFLFKIENALNDYN